MADLRGLDLNLLIIFQYLLEERSLSAVARRMNLSQPAVSHALRRLRTAFDDELFVRTAAGMQPTPLAERLAEPVAEALALLSSMLEVRDAFDPATSRRRFTLALSDVGEIHFMPELVALCARLAPGVRIDVVRTTGAELRRSMEAGRVDIAVGVFENLGAGFFQRLLFRQGYLTLLQRDHPLAGAEISREAFLASEHLIVTQAAPYGQINEALRRAGVNLSRHFSVPHFGAVPYIVADSALLATVPRKLAEVVAPRFGLATVPPPIRIPWLQTHVFWTRRLHRDAGHQWLRQQIIEVFADRASGAA
ncbi:MAG: LysR family transcriptional regulator [Pigmentiphaga sp.]